MRLILCAVVLALAAGPLPAQCRACDPPSSYSYRYRERGHWPGGVRIIEGPTYTWDGTRWLPGAPWEFGGYGGGQQFAAPTYPCPCPLCPYYQGGAQLSAGGYGGLQYGGYGGGYGGIAGNFSAGGFCPTCPQPGGAAFAAPGYFAAPSSPCPTGTCPRR